MAIKDRYKNVLRGGSRFTLDEQTTSPGQGYLDLFVDFISELPSFPEGYSVNRVRVRDNFSFIRTDVALYHLFYSMLKEWDTEKDSLGYTFSWYLRMCIPELTLHHGNCLENLCPSCDRLEMNHDCVIFVGEEGKRARTEAKTSEALCYSCSLS